ncbi:MAG: isoaspartyl peptidase/L-asparaginase [Candidatus Wallbacteria bacterium]|nr:isoaspartyl peptidase/L-asparaginase [Candidatus Wallbacteria bacterium]
MKPAIIVHGGAGKVKVKASTARMMKKALKHGYDLLLSGNSAVAAVEAAVMVMENSACFNAGYGSYPRLDGEVRCDAAIMDSSQNCGAVAGLCGIKNPIHLARLIMEHTDHVLFTNEGAVKLAEMWKLKKADLLSPWRKKRWEAAVKKIRAGKQVSSYFTKIQQYIEKFGTVGAVAIDKSGLIAAATSTGGIFLQLAGRVGDTPLIGCGNYTDEWGGCSATGHGESIIKLALAKEAVMHMENETAGKALKRVMDRARSRSLSMGAIAVDYKGNVALDYTTLGMNWAYFDKQGQIHSYDY